MDEKLKEHQMEAFDLGQMAADADRLALGAPDAENCLKAKRLHEAAAAAWGRFLKMSRHA